MGSERGRIRWVLAPLAVLLGACGGNADEVSFADLDVIDRDAQARLEASSDFAPATDGLDLDVGDDVRTDSTGFAEIAYADGSLTRLGADTAFRVVELGGDATLPDVAVHLEDGTSWNRVRPVTGKEGGFELQTPVGTAAVRGTAFAVACDAGGPCSFDVTEGQVVVATSAGDVTIDEGESVDLDAAGDELRRGAVDTDDPWIARNLPRDDSLHRFGRLLGDCSVSVNGRNVARTTARDPLEVPIDGTLVVDSASIGDVDSYTVDTAFGPFQVRAGDGEVTGPDGTRNRWAADVAVEPRAVWGVGLYEVNAETTGTPCDLRAFVRVTGRHPIATPAGAGGLLALLLGLLGVAYAWYRAHRAQRLRRESS